MQGNFNIETIMSFSQALRSAFTRYIEPFYYFRFSYANPLLWIFFLFLLLILLRFWKLKKALSFCAIIILLLLATTKIELYVSSFLQQQDIVFDPVLFRAIPLFLFALIIVYYIFIRDQE